ncbi:type VI secretion system Vgr family protein [Lysobacter changpingensis]|uniref:type VI secretion system Vgr family protein n=1 Tax=Lysobacter changpingensis TaxID=2792784 RepID=UPI001A8C91AE|nr:type VI secretion system Vgr family protein [Lysobacter changpingensis]
MANRSDLRFRIHFDADVALDVVRFDLEEGLSRPFRLSLELSSESDDIDLDAVLDTEATFAIECDSHPVRNLLGVCTMFERCETGFRRTRYRAVIEPALARLGLWHGSQIHQQQTVPDILRERLAQRGVQARITALRSHETREYCVQHRETELGFVSRLAAEEGFVYYFDPRQHSQLVLTDQLISGPRLPGADDIGTVAYQPNPGGDAGEPRLWHFGLRRQLAPTRTVQRDTTFRNPQYSLEHRSDARDGVGEFEHYDALGRYKRDEVGKPFTATRLQQLRTGSTIATLEGDDARLWPGLSFLLEDHTSDAINRDWRVIAMHHSGEQAVSQEEESAAASTGTHYSYTAQAVPGDMEWRPAPLPRPVMDGPQVALVVGPANEEVHVDPQGRIMVWFPWDRAGERDGASCWIRVSQDWAGAGYGGMLPPRVGHQVIVSFMDGDPDQPVVTGRAYTERNLPPYRLPALKTLSTLKSKEHKGGGYNELLIDDTTGELKTQLRSTHASTQLTMGYITHPREPDGRGKPRGEGFELRTDAAGAVRAARGLLFTAFERANAGSGQLDQRELLECATALVDLIRTLTGTAGQHQGLSPESGPSEGLLDAVDKLGAGANDRKGETGAKSILAATAPAGLVLATPASMLLGAGQAVDCVAERDHSTTAGEHVRITAGKGIAQFAVEGGIRHIAHQGEFVVQAQSDSIRVQADQSIEISASEKHIQIAAKEELRLLCGGACMTMRDGDVEFVLPGTFTVKATEFHKIGPDSRTVPFPDFPITSRLPMRRTMRLTLGALPGFIQGYEGEPYRLFADGALLDQGLADDRGTIKWEHKDGTQTYAVELTTGQRFEIDALESFSDDKEERAQQLHANEGRHPYEHEGEEPMGEEFQGKNFGAIWTKGSGE